MKRLLRGLWCVGLLACASPDARPPAATAGTGGGGVPAAGSGGGGAPAAGGASGRDGGAGALADAGPSDVRLEVGAKTCGAYALCDDFESVAAGAAPDPARWTVGAPNVTGTGALAVDESQHHSGARSVKVTGQGGYSNHVFFTNRSALAGIGGVMWGRFYMRLSEPLGEGHVSFLAMKDAADGDKYLRMGGQAKVLMWNRESDDATLPALSPAGAALSRVLPAQQWLCVEVMVDGDSGTLRTWLDEVEVPGLTVDGTSTPDVDEQWHRRQSWRPDLVDFSLGWESYAGQAMTLWFDDVVIDGARVGCGAAGSGGQGQAGVDAGVDATGAPASGLEALQREFVELRFGMFLHFGILTYTGSWAQPNLDVSQFNPTALDPSQWADAAVAAHMKYGVLTAKHHDGFALWPSAASDFNVGHVPWMNGKGDVVRAYVDAFRARGLAPGLYYSIYDTTRGVVAGALDATKLAYVKTQLTELLSNYGPIPILVIDGWSWQMGHQAVAYQEIHALVKSLQPSCLLTDHTHLADPWEVDVVNFEEPVGAFAPAGNTYPGQQEQKVNAAGGNDWFWSPSVGGLMDVPNIVTGHLQQLEPRWTNFLLNLPPNRAGRLDDSMVSLLQQVGKAWTPNAARPPLPAQGAQNVRPYTPVSASATSGAAQNAVDGRNDGGFISMWQPTGALPQSLTLDLGQVRPDVAWLGYVPRYASHVSSKDGNVTRYGVLLSTDGASFTEAASGTWPADARMHAATFTPRPARYVRLEVRAVNGTAAAVTEVSVGGAR